MESAGEGDDTLLPKRPGISKVGFNKHLHGEPLSDMGRVGLVGSYCGSAVTGLKSHGLKEMGWPFGERHMSFVQFG
jgi:hypothetical protein